MQEQRKIMDRRGRQVPFIKEPAREEGSRSPCVITFRERQGERRHRKGMSYTVAHERWGTVKHVGRCANTR